MLINSRCPCAGFCVVFDFDFVKKRCSTYPKLDKTIFGAKSKVGIQLESVF